MKRMKGFGIKRHKLFIEKKIKLLGFSIITRRYAFLAPLRQILQKADADL